MSKIPHRWTAYKPIGERIAGTRFVAFKVPLRSQVNQSVDEEHRLDIAGLLRSQPDLGLIIDLTNTTRYYNPQNFESAGVQYKKLCVPGHATPHKSLVRIFKTYVSIFLRDNEENDKLIGVHCTHGVNRTGYLICNYMVSELAIEPSTAMRLFDEARGHKIERPNYVSSLHALASDRLEPDYEEQPSTNWRNNHESRTHRDIYIPFSRDYRQEPLLAHTGSASWPGAVRNSGRNSVRDSVRDSWRDSGRDSVRDSWRSHQREDRNIAACPYSDNRASSYTYCDRPSSDHYNRYHFHK